MDQVNVAIIGAGPAGLLLSHLLHRAGVESVVLEARSRDYVEQRVRAGVLEHPTVELLTEVGVADRLRREGLEHRGVNFRFDGERHRFDFEELTGRTITVYGQQEVVKDLIAQRLADGGDVRFEVADVAVEGLGPDLDGEPPTVRFTHEGEPHELRADLVAGCDGFHGVCRGTIPAGVLQVFERSYPAAWLGILAEAAPASEELIYAYSDRGFALHSMRTPQITRNYLQVSPDEDLAAWPDDRIWEELQARLGAGSGWALNEGPLLEKGITGMRSFVVEPMQYGRLFLAGDAAHIVPPTGAKGMNLAIADVSVLARAIAAWFGEGRADGLAAYSATCLRRVWRAEHFSWWMTSMLHRLDDDPFQQRLQLSQLRYTVSSRAAATTLAENYVGLPHG
jgi:p-hydroxybenzoate 3-monooxygenase